MELILKRAQERALAGQDGFLARRLVVSEEFPVLKEVLEDLAHVVPIRSIPGVAPDGAIQDRQGRPHIRRRPIEEKGKGLLRSRQERLDVGWMRVPVAPAQDAPDVRRAMSRQLLFPSP